MWVYATRSEKERQLTDDPGPDLWSSWGSKNMSWPTAQVKVCLGLTYRWLPKLEDNRSPETPKANVTPGGPASVRVWRSR